MTKLNELFARIDALKAQLDILRPLDKDREARAMQKFRLWWTYHSNAIEGNALSQGETEVFLMEGLTAKGKPLKDHLDLKGHNDAIVYLLEFVRSKEEFTEAFIRELHKILLGESYRVPAETPDGQPSSKIVMVGQYKSSANHVRTPTGEIHYYATPEETPSKMHDLMTWYRTEKAVNNLHPVEVIAQYNHRFTAIHPFDDGNGRMSRLIMNLMLLQLGYPPVVIRLSKRNQYLAALRLADSGDCDDFTSLIADHVSDSLELFIRAAKGEEISEATDLRKEIRLEIMRLKQNKEPEKRTRENLLRLYEDSIIPLVKEIGGSLAEFCEVFSENEITFRSSVSKPNTSTSRNGKMPLLRADLTQHVRECFFDGYSIDRTDVSFVLRGFQRGGYNIFDLSASLQIICEPLKYSVNIQVQPSVAPMLHFYQEVLTSDEIRTSADRVARYFLKTIRENSKNQGGT